MTWISVTAASCSFECSQELVVVQERKLGRLVSLEELKKFKKQDLKDMQLFTTARLSVQNVTDEEWGYVLRLEKTPEIST